MLSENFHRADNEESKEVEEELVVPVVDVKVEAKERREQARAKVNFFA